MFWSALSQLHLLSFVCVAHMFFENVFFLFCAKILVSNFVRNTQGTLRRIIRLSVPSCTVRVPFVFLCVVNSVISGETPKEHSGENDGTLRREDG